MSSNVILELCLFTEQGLFIILWYIFSNTEPYVTCINSTLLCNTIWTLILFLKKKEIKQSTLLSDGVFFYLRGSYDTNRCKLLLKLLLLCGSDIVNEAVVE